MHNNTDFLSLEKPFDYNELKKKVEQLQTKYNFLDVSSIGKSILGKDLPLITLGNGKKSVIYIGGHHGMEWITSAILIQFIKDICEEYSHSSSVFDISSRILLETRKLYIIPMLNPDGIGYTIDGISPDNVLKNRLHKINPSNNFAHWQANARGVDLNHNYNAGFKEYKLIEKSLNILSGAACKYSGEYPESEPETKSLCSFVRWASPELALTLHTQGEEINYTSGGKICNNSLPLVKTLSRLTGYKIDIKSETQAQVESPAEEESEN